MKQVTKVFADLGLEQAEASSSTALTESPIQQSLLEQPASHIYPDVSNAEDWSIDMSTTHAAAYFGQPSPAIYPQSVMATERSGERKRRIPSREQSSSIPDISTYTPMNTPQLRHRRYTGSPSVQLGQQSIERTVPLTPALQAIVQKSRRRLQAVFADQPFRDAASIARPPFTLRSRSKLHGQSKLIINNVLQYCTQTRVHHARQTTAQLTGVSESTVYRCSKYADDFKAKNPNTNHLPSASVSKCRPPSRRMIYEKAACSFDNLKRDLVYFLVHVVQQVY